jgi:tetratricopeptide (TPR) repeat protein
VCQILAEISVRFAGTEVAVSADDERGRLMGDGKVKPKMLKAIENAKGGLLNDRAAESETTGRYLESLKLYRTVTEDFPDTDAARTASESLDRLTADPKVQDTIRGLRATEEAERWLDIGDRFAKIEMYGKAREYYQRVLDTHPGTQAAPKAQERLARVPEEKSDEEEAEPPAEEDEEPAPPEETAG